MRFAIVFIQAYAAFALVQANVNHVRSLRIAATQPSNMPWHGHLADPNYLRDFIARLNAIANARLEVGPPEEPEDPNIDRDFIARLIAIANEPLEVESPEEPEGPDILTGFLQGIDLDDLEPDALIGTWPPTPPAPNNAQRNHNHNHNGQMHGGTPTPSPRAS